MNSTTATDSYEKKRSVSIRSKGWAKSLVIQLLARLQYGSLTIRDGKDILHFGKEHEPRARVTINDPGTWKRVLFGGSVGAGEAYIDQQWEVDDLTALVRIMVLNMALLDRMERGLAWLLTPLRLVSHHLNRNSKQGSRANIISHYDLGNDLYKSFLDPTMMYSSAIYSDSHSTLEEAAVNKLETICRKLNLKSTDQVVEIGSGWGGFALYAASTYGCHVTTTTISDAQYREASRRIEASGLTDKITLLKQDYRDLTGKYDKLVSIEMIEAVGNTYLPQFFSVCEKLLKKDGTMLIQAITIADQKYGQYLRGVDFIQRHIFPGGCVVSNTRMMSILATRTDMVVRHLEDFGYDYAKTLNSWRERFHRALLQLEEKGYDQRFRRLWDFYLSYCEGGFRERAISVVQLVATRPESRLVVKT